MLWWVVAECVFLLVIALKQFSSHCSLSFSLSSTIWYYYNIIILTYKYIHCLPKGDGGGNLRRGGGETNIPIPECPPFKAFISNLPPDVDARFLKDRLFHGYVNRSSHLLLLSLYSLLWPLLQICFVLSVVSIINMTTTHLYNFQLSVAGYPHPYH